MWMYLFIIVIIAFAVWYGLKERKKIKEQMAQGILIERDAGFYEYEETFMLHGDWDAVWGALRKADYHGSISAGDKLKGVCAVDYKSAQFTAKFSQINSESPDTQIYKFRFASWESRKGIPYGLNQMNILLTTVEKTLLQIDPNTQISTKKLDFKTKHKFF